MYSTHCSDAVLAHLIILLQNDWPQQESLFLAVIKHIQRQGSFTYNMFFSYVFGILYLDFRSGSANFTEALFYH